MQAVKHAFRILFSAALLSAVIGCAGNARKQATGGHIDDAWITSGVKAAFVEDSELKASEIPVATSGGTVRLSGFAADAGDVKHAAGVAAGIKGVTLAGNDIPVK